MEIYRQSRNRLYWRDVHENHIRVIAQPYTQELKRNKFFKFEFCSALVTRIIYLNCQHSVAFLSKYLFMLSKLIINQHTVWLMCNWLTGVMLSCFVIFIHRKETSMCMAGPPVHLVSIRLLLCCSSSCEENRGDTRHRNQCNSVLLPDAVCHASYDILQVRIYHISINLWDITCVILIYYNNLWNKYESVMTQVWIYNTSKNLILQLSIYNRSLNV